MPPELVELFIACDSKSLWTFRDSNLKKSFSNCQLIMDGNVLQWRKLIGSLSIYFLLPFSLETKPITTTKLQSKCVLWRAKLTSKREQDRTILMSSTKRSIPIKQHLHFTQQNNKWDKFLSPPYYAVCQRWLIRSASNRGSIICSARDFNYEAVQRRRTIHYTLCVWEREKLCVLCAVEQNATAAFIMIIMGQLHVPCPNIELSRGFWKCRVC